MATTTKTTPAKATPAKAAPALDLGSLSVSDTAAPERVTSGRQRSEMSLYFERFLKESADNPTRRPTATNANAWIGAGKSVTVPEANAQEVVYAIRSAAAHLDYGVTVTDIKDTKWKRPGGKVEIRFAAKTRKQKRTQNK